MLPEKYQNSVIHGDALETLADLPDNCLNMVYADPDYNVGISYDGTKYKMEWEEYIGWYVILVGAALTRLRQDGNMFLINYPKANSYLRVSYLDRVAYDVNEYVWVYPTNIGHSPRRFTNAHRSILHVTKSKDNAWYKEQVAEPYKNPGDARIKRRIADGSKGRMPYSWMEYNMVKNVSKDKTDHPCQIPIPLYNKLLEASTKVGDSVFVLFGGSGKEVGHTKAKGRMYLTCELSEKYYKDICDIVR